MIRKDFADRIAWAADEKYVRAMRALAEGKASDFQQKLCWSWLLLIACRVDETTFWPADPSATAFLEGRRSVGVDTVALTKTKLKEDSPNG